MGQLIAGIPNHDRPRERLLSRGVAALSDRELLAIVLRDGARNLSAVDLAGELLSWFGGMSRLSRALPEELVARRGVGAAKACAVVAGFELGRRTNDDRDRLVLRSAEDVAGLAMRELSGSRRERVLVVACDAANQVVQTIVVADGALDRSVFPIREILNAVLRHDGRAFAVAHNHPSGDATPSREDGEATADLQRAAGVVGLRFLGHVVVADDSWTSATAPPTRVH